MKIALALLFAAATAVAQQNPTTIRSIGPTSGSIGGGDVVLISYTGLGPPVCDPIACVFRVFFDGVEARSTHEIDAGLLRVITPAHPRGNAVVTLRLFDQTVATSPYVFRFAGMDEIGAPDTFNFETVLVPIAIGGEQPVPGAFGSRWTTDLQVSNSGDQDVEFFPGYPVCMQLNPRGCIDMRFPVLPAHTTRQITFSSDVTSAGYLFYVQKGGAENIQFSLRVRDVSRSRENAGTELPVVRIPSETFSSVTLLNVPVEATSRTMLRIYGNGNFPAHVRVFQMSDDALVFEGDVPGAPADLQPYGETHGFPARSVYAQIGFPVAQPGSYRVVVTGAGNWTWALATVTNNDTQLVTAIAPRLNEPYGVIRR